MPAPQIKKLAAKAGHSDAKAEELWKKAKEQAKGKKLKDGTTIGSSEKQWGDNEWAYVTGIFKRMLGLKESLTEDGIIGVTGYGMGSDNCSTPGRKIRSKGKGRGMGVGRGRGPVGRMGDPNNMGRGRGPVEQYRVYVNGNFVEMIQNGQMVDIGENEEVDRVRMKIYDLLDYDVDTAFEVSGFTGSLQEIEQQIMRDWVLFCTGRHAGPRREPVAVYADQEM
jgi:hypothetical protein